MLFSSNVFLFVFLPVTLLLYYVSPRKLRNPVLLLWSLVFYGWGEPVYLFLMIATIILNYVFGWIIHSRHSRNQGAKGALVGGVAVMVFFTISMNIITSSNRMRRTIGPTIISNRP